MSRYELLRLAQLLFALVLMFGAFLAGLAIGWWRWGRGSERPAPGAADRRAGPLRDADRIAPRPARRPVGGDLFTPADPSTIVLDDPVAVGSSFSPGPRELAPSVDPFST